MAVDLQVVFPQVVIPLNSVKRLLGMVPQTLDLTGDFRGGIDQVLINGMPSPSVVIVSVRRVLAQVPPQLLNVTLTSVTVTSNAFSASARSLLRFRIGTTASKTSGIMRLVQIFLKILFTTPGTDIFAPRVGGNALKDIGLTFSKDQGGSIVGDLIVATNTTQRQITAIQSRDPSLPRDERLLAAKVISAGYNRQEGALIASIELTSQAGRAATANIMV